MTPRLNPFAAAPKLMQPWREWGLGLLKTGVLEESLQQLVEIRASQMNGCAICLAMHTSEARQAGESEERIYLLDGWRESAAYTARERAALEWTEALTRVADTHAPDAAYEAVKAQFTPEEQVALTLLIVAINGWNRLNVGFRTIVPATARAAA